jgi:uncharacterized protein YndB with AHSA1/START domain
MLTLQFKININAHAERVWFCLWDEDNYRKWTAPFSEGSHYKTDSFTEGNKIHFLTLTGEGMYSILEKIVENKYLAFKHIGLIKDFEEQPFDEQTISWTNAMETYQLNPLDNGTEVVVSVDTVDEYIEHMNKLFPIALKELKKIAEQK